MVDIKQELTWLQKHERLILGTFILLTILFLGNWWINSSARNADLKLAAMQTELQMVKDESAKRESDFNAFVKTATEQNQALVDAIKQRQVITIKQQQADKTMPLPELGKRWQELLALPSGELQATDKGIVASENAARATVSELEVIPMQEYTIKNNGEMLASKDTEIAKATDVITSLKKQITVADQTCQAKVDDERKNARKGKMKWFKIGYVAGLVTGVAADVAVKLLKP